MEEKCLHKVIEMAESTSEKVDVVQYRQDSPGEYFIPVCQMLNGEGTLNITMRNYSVYCYQSAALGVKLTVVLTDAIGAYVDYVEVDWGDNSPLETISGPGPITDHWHYYDAPGTYAGSVRVYTVEAVRTVGDTLDHQFTFSNELL